MKEAHGIHSSKVTPVLFPNEKESLIDLNKDLKNNMEF